MNKYALLILASALPAMALADAPPLKSKAEFQNDSKQICTKEWTKRGELDVDMFNYCFESQMEGYEQLKEFHQYADQNFYSEVSFPYCSGDWTERGVVNAFMMAHCLEQEIEGVKDVEYFRTQYDAARVNAVAAGAINDYHSWSMAAYVVKEEFE